MIQELIVRIPDEAMPMVEAAAGSDGWTPTVINAEGETVPNPEVALMHMLLMTIRLIGQRTIDVQAGPAMEATRQAIVDDVQGKMQAWIDLVTTSQRN